MTDKDKVLAKEPHALVVRETVHKPDIMVSVYRIATGRSRWTYIGTGPTESEAWANAAKGLE